MQFIQLQEQVKIWFSVPQAKEDPPEPTVFGGEMNLQRIRAFLHDNPEVKLTIITNMAQLERAGSIRQRDAIIEFVQSQHGRIKWLDIDDITISSSCKDKSTQDMLLHFAKKELSDPYGNVAAASDIIRTLSPILQIGLYTDFDYNFSGMIPKEIIIPSASGLLTNSASRLTNDGVTKFALRSLNNDFLLTTDPESNFMRTYRNTLLDNYLSRDRFQDRRTFKQKCPEKYSENLRTQICEVSGPAVLWRTMENFFKDDPISGAQTSNAQTPLKPKKGMLDGSWTEIGKERLKRLNQYVHALLDEKIISATEQVTHERIFDLLISNIQNPRIRKHFDEEYAINERFRALVLQRIPDFDKNNSSSLQPSSGSLSRNPPT